MSRQLQIRASEQASALSPDRSSTPANLTRLAVALAPDILQIAERVAARRRERINRVAESSAPIPPANAPQEGVRISEVEVDFSLPFVRRVTRREAVAWREMPVVAADEPKKTGRLKKAGLLGASGAVAVAAGLLARRIGPRLSDRDKVIDVEGWRR